MKIIKLWVDSRFGEAVVNEDGSLCTFNCPHLLSASGPMHGLRNDCRLDMVHVFPKSGTVVAMVRSARCRQAELDAVEMKEQIERYQERLGRNPGLSTEEQKGKSSA